MDKILIPVLIVAGIGLLAGIILAVASAIMAVPKDEKAEAILEVLPGANCGACGFSGCSGYAAALSKGEAQPGLCSPGGEACAKACAELLGTGDVAVEKKTALVHCMGNYDCTSDKMRYDGIDSCAASTLLAGGISSCRYGCMGMGDCAAVCEYGAINVCNGMASIDPAKCRGCAKCTAACPKGLISFVPLKKQAVVRCSNCDKGVRSGRRKGNELLREGRSRKVHRLRQMCRGLPEARHYHAGRVIFETNRASAVRRGFFVVKICNPLFTNF